MNEREGVYIGAEAISEAEARGEALIRIGGKLVISGKVYEAPEVDGERLPMAIRNDLLNSGALAPRDVRRSPKPNRAKPIRHKPRTVEEMLQGFGRARA
jgi:hypothetical protein